MKWLAGILIFGAINAQELPKFMGRQVTIIDSGRSEDGFDPKGPATLCAEPPPQRQCYTMPKEYGNEPDAKLVQIDRSTTALLFSAQSGGVSGYNIHFALLHPSIGKDLEDLF